MVEWSTYAALIAVAIVYLLRGSSKGDAPRPPQKLIRGEFLGTCDWCGGNGYVMRFADGREACRGCLDRARG